MTLGDDFLQLRSRHTQVPPEASGFFSTPFHISRDSFRGNLGHTGGGRNDQAALKNGRWCVPLRAGKPRAVASFSACPTLRQLEPREFPEDALPRAGLPPQPALRPAGPGVGFPEHQYVCCVHPCELPLAHQCPRRGCTGRPVKAGAEDPSQVCPAESDPLLWRGFLVREGIACRDPLAPQRRRPSPEGLAFILLCSQRVHWGRVFLLLCFSFFLS